MTGFFLVILRIVSNAVLFFKVTSVSSSAGPSWAVPCSDLDNKGYLFSFALHGGSKK